MANQYMWKIEQLECYPQQGDRTNVVFFVCWRRVAVNGQYTADIYGAQRIELDPAGPFIPYENLTESQVVGWLESSFGAETLAAQTAVLDEKINVQVNPPTVRPILPWSTDGGRP